jgi:nucleoside-diphosphate-sugar epimerase
MMRVLIIGGTSFTGPYLVRRLHEMGHQVAVFHRGQTEGDLPEDVMRFHGHLRDLPSFKRDLDQFGPEIVVHMIASVAQDAWTYVRMFEGMARRGIVVSSQDVYRTYNRLRRKETGPPDPIPLTEEAPLREVLFPYRDEPMAAVTDAERKRRIEDYDKILVERIVMNETSLPCTVLRLPAVYGPRDPQRRMLDYLKRMEDGRPAILLDEDGARWRWTRGYAENVAQAVFLTVTDERAEGRIYNVGEPDSLTERGWIERIADAAGWSGRIVELPRDQLPSHLKVEDLDWSHHLVSDTNRIRTDLGFDEPVACEEAFHRTVAWERANPPPQIDPDRFAYEAEDAALSDFA